MYMDRHISHLPSSHASLPSLRRGRRTIGDSHGGAASAARATREEVRWLCGSQVSWKRFATSRNLGSCRGDHQKSISASCLPKVADQWYIW